MPETTLQTKKVLGIIDGDPNDQTYQITVEPGAMPRSVLDAMGLPQDAYQVMKPGSNAGVFHDNDNVFTLLKDGDKLRIVPKSPVAD